MAGGMLSSEKINTYRCETFGDVADFGRFSIHVLDDLLGVSVMQCIAEKPIQQR